MRNLPVNENTTEAKPLHLFEIEMAMLIVDSVITTTKYIVNDIEKCYVDMKIAHAYNSGGVDIFEIRTITAVEPLLNAITVNTAFTQISENDTLVETLYDATTLPKIAGSIDYLQFYHSAFGTYTGKVHMTDYDLPIVTEGERFALAYSADYYTGQIVYLPMSVFYQGTEFDSKGKSSTIEMAITNVNQLMGGVMLKHLGLKEREVIVKTAYVEDALSEKYSLVVPITISGKTTQVSRTNGSYAPDMALNDIFTSVLYINPINVVTEFEGTVDSATSDNKTVSLQATVKIDSSESVSLPTRMYNRLRCPFVYKSWRCRFSPKMTLRTAMTVNTTGYILIETTSLFYYFKEIEAGESSIIKIGEELIVINGFKDHTGITSKVNEQVRQLTIAQRNAELAANQGFFTLNVITRGYGSTTVTTHADGDPIDIITCKKTEHDCNMHGHDAYFGAFPAIPKNKNYNE